MIYRIVYTVIRNIQAAPCLEKLKENFQGIKEEAGEYLYGGGLDDSIEAKLQGSSDGGVTWEDIA